MRQSFILLLLFAGWACRMDAGSQSTPPFKRIVILKVDGLNDDLLQETMQQRDPVSGRSRLPWFQKIFGESGAIFDNFYVRGISLSAPSWSMLDTGRHTVIRGNVEYDRYTGQVYDYLNIFPFYLGYARNRIVDMPGVQVLDRAGIPLLIDRFPYERVHQSFQLFQRGVRWTTLKDALTRSFSRNALFSMLESAAPISLSSSLSKQQETEMEAGLRAPGLLYLDLFIGDVDHEGHATSDPDTMLHVLEQLDMMLGRIWAAIEQGPWEGQTLLVVVSDHGMNNVAGVVSQTFSLADLFNRAEGGAHHVVTDREQMSDYKLKGINPLVHRVITPSAASFYLKDQGSRYPTAWLDIDGNERTAVHLRNSDLNKIQILLQQLQRGDLRADVRRAAARELDLTIDRHRSQWTATVAAMNEELATLDRAIEVRKRVVAALPKKNSEEERESGQDKADRRLRQELQAWQNESAGYKAYVAHVVALLAFKADGSKPFSGNISDLVPEMALGDNNQVFDLQHYVAGPSAEGLTVDAQGNLDTSSSFRYVDYFPLLSRQVARNNPQPALSPKPIDFMAMPLPPGQYAEDRAEGSTSFPASVRGGDRQQAYWLYGTEQEQLLIVQSTDGLLTLRPVARLRQDKDGKIQWTTQPWRPGLPLRLFEDPQLGIPPSQDRASWLSGWHTEEQWMKTIHKCRYSNGVIGITEELSPVGVNVPGMPGMDPVRLRYERRRRELVQADFHVFAADHWNFNVRFPNPGGNHGSFLRISTHSVWMMAGAGITAQHVSEPHDSLSFASTLLSMMGRTPPMPDIVVKLQ